MACYDSPPINYEDPEQSSTSYTSDISEMSDTLNTPAFVSIGISPDASFTMSRRAFEILFGFFIIIVACIAIVVFFLTLYFSIQQQPIITKKPSTLPKRPNSFSKKSDYQELGSLNINNLNNQSVQINIIDQFFGDPSICSNTCDQTPSCNGFIHNDNWCTLLTGKITIPSSDTIQEISGPTLYSKNSHNIIFDDRILLATNSFAVPNKYWLNSKPNQSLLFPKNKVIKLNFFPKYIKIHNPYTGIYCPFPFKISDIPNLIESNLCYVHSPNDDLNIFPDYKGNTMYVAYI